MKNKRHTLVTLAVRAGIAVLVCLSGFLLVDDVPPKNALLGVISVTAVFFGVAADSVYKAMLCYGRYGELDEHRIFSSAVRDAFFTFGRPLQWLMAVATIPASYECWNSSDARWSVPFLLSMLISIILAEAQMFYYWRKGRRLREHVFWQN